MIIVHIIYCFDTGGAEALLLDIVNRQAYLGHDVTLIVINDLIGQEYIDSLDCRVHQIFYRRKSGSRSLDIVFKLNYDLFRIWPDAIHLHNHSITKFLFCPRPKYLTVHALNISLSTTCSKLKELFAISDAVRDDVAARYPNKYNLVTIPNGINISLIQRKESLGLKSEIMRVINVARLDSEKKGQDLLIDAIALLKNRGYSNIIVDFIGEGDDEEKLKNLVSARGVEDNVNLLGLKTREYVYEHLKDYDLMCHPSRYEGFGLTVAEGIAAGLPVLVPDSDGPYEIIQRGKLGFIFNIGNAESLADALERIYNHYQDEAIQLVKPAYDYIKSNFSMEHMVDRYIEEYK